MIAGGRSKWNLPNPSHEIDASHQQLLPIAPTFVERLEVAMLPRRRWLLGRSLLRGNPTREADPGCRKSTKPPAGSARSTSRRCSSIAGSRRHMRTVVTLPI
jgi:hypothetical protein